MAIQDGRNCRFLSFSKLLNIKTTLQQCAHYFARTSAFKLFAKPSCNDRRGILRRCYHLRRECVGILERQQRSLLRTHCHLLSCIAVTVTVGKAYWVFSTMTLAAHRLVAHIVSV